eukprot:6469298-Lingulodinium_polyedra.AAC.1
MASGRGEVCGLCGDERVGVGATVSCREDDDDEVLGTEVLRFSRRLLGVTVRTKAPTSAGTMAAVELDAGSLEAPPSSRLVRSRSHAGSRAPDVQFFLTRLTTRIMSTSV